MGPMSPRRAYGPYFSSKRDELHRPYELCGPAGHPYDPSERHGLLEHYAPNNLGHTFSAGPIGLGPTDRMDPMSPMSFMGHLTLVGPAGPPRSMNAKGPMGLPRPMDNVGLVSPMILTSHMVPKRPRSPMGPISLRALQAREALGALYGPYELYEPYKVHGPYWPLEPY